MRVKRDPGPPFAGPLLTLGLLVAMALYATALGYTASSLWFSRGTLLARGCVEDLDSRLVSVPGVNLGYTAHGSGSSTWLYQPTIAFRDTAGLIRMFSATSAWAPRHVGDSVLVRYRPEPEGAARVGTFLGQFGEALVCALAGTAALALAMLLQAALRHTPKHDPADHPAG